MRGQRLVCSPFEAGAGCAALSKYAARVLLAAGLCVACGGEKAAGTGDSDGQAFDQCAEAAGLDKVLIGDFEGAVATTWYTSYDNTPTAIINPVAGSNPPTTPIDVPRCGPSGSALHVTATGLLSYGYSVGFNVFNNVPGNPSTYFDAGGFAGIAFWVRKGSDASGSTIFASVADRSTQPTAPAPDFFVGSERSALLPEVVCPPPTVPPQTPACVARSAAYCLFDAIDTSDPPDGTVDPLQSQCDRFGAGMGLGLEWRFYKVPFSKMRQRAYGRAAYDPQPDSRILGVEFGLDGETWDFWLDDVAFYKETAPAN